MTIFSADIHQYELSRLDWPLRFFIVKRRRVRSAPNDVGISPVVCIAQLERIRHLRINFVFPLRLRREGLRALVRFDADVDRVLKDFEFHRGFLQAHLREYWKRALDVETTLFRPSRGE